MYPGDNQKALRNRLYRKPGFLKSDPSDEAIQAAAEEDPGEEDPDAKPDPPKDLTPDEQILKTRKEAEAAKVAEKIVITTPEEYEAASVKLAYAKKGLRENEKKRKDLTTPLLDAKRKIDDAFKETAVIWQEVIDTYEPPMAAFKMKERDDLRKQEEERQQKIKEAEDKAKAEATKAKADLEAMRQQTESEDPFLAALAAMELPEAKEDVREALVEVALASTRVEMPEAIAPIVGSGTRVSFPWFVEVTNEEMVDRKYCSPDQTKLNALAKRLKEVLGDDIHKLNPLDYPGLSITEKARIAGR
jgi:hypothetical protein